MKKKNILSLVLALLLFVSSSGLVSAVSSAKEVVMFLHDTHSHLNPFATVED